MISTLSKSILYFLLVPTLIWLSFAGFSLLVTFSYTDNPLAWIPYIILGGWVPGKWYGLTLLHSIFCIAISFGIISTFDKLLFIPRNLRTIILILVTLFFAFEAVFNFFFQSGQNIEIEIYRSSALLQLSFLIGILIKTFNPDAEMK